MNTWGYDAQPSYLGSGYDLCSASATDYDSGPVLIGNERKARARANCAVFAQFAGFLAAETLSELEISASRYPQLSE